MNIVSALEQSCDVYFYEIALKTGIQKIRDMALRLGLGALTGVDLPGEKSGIIPSHEWKLATKGVVWTPGETVVAGIGQGYVLTTPMQLAVMTARIANGKDAVVPSLLSKPNDAVQNFAPLDISESALAVIRRGMSAVLYGGAGTANSYKLAKNMVVWLEKQVRFRSSGSRWHNVKKASQKILTGHGQNVTMRCLWLMPR